MASFQTDSVSAPFSAWFLVGPLLIGFYLVIGRYFIDARVRARTVYGLTDRRVEVISRNPSSALSVVHLTNITSVSLKRERYGKRTIDIGTDIVEYSGDSQWKQSLSFDFITDAAAVQKLIENARAIYSTNQA